MKCQTCGNELPVDLSPCPVCDPWSTGTTATGSGTQDNQSMTAQQVFNKLGISSTAIDVHDLVGALGGLLLFISFFVGDIGDSTGTTISLANDGGFFGALVAVFAGLCTIALFVPKVRAQPAPWLVAAGIGFGLAIGGPGYFSGTAGATGQSVSYSAGFWLALLGGLALCYGWLRRAMGWGSPQTP